MVANDFVEQLGASVLDHRFKRLSQRLLDEAARLYEAAGLEFRPRWASTYRLLDERGAVAVGEIADELRLSHPAVIQLGNEMLVAGLVRSAPDPRDGRRRLLSLTPRARRMRSELRVLWDELGREQAQLFARAGVADVLEVLTKLERFLHEESLADRVLAATAPAD